MPIQEIKTKDIFRIVLIIGLIIFVVFVGYKYKQFRTTILEKEKIEQAKKTKENLMEAERKVFEDKWSRCDTIKPVLDIIYQKKLLSVNLDCVDAWSIFKLMSEKTGFKISPSGLGFLMTPISFNNLTINDGLNLIAKNFSNKDEKLIARYQPDKNIWSLNLAIIEVKDPPINGVIAIVDTKDSFDFIKADGTNKVSYDILKWSRIRKSSNDKFVAIIKYYSKDTEEFIVLNDQGDVQWKLKMPDNFDPNLDIGYTVSNNGKYIVVTDSQDPECDESCTYSSYIVTEKGIKEIKYLPIKTISFSPDGNSFIGSGYLDDFFDVFDYNGNELYTKKSPEEIERLMK